MLTDAKDETKRKKTHLLAYAGISGEDIGILCYGKCRWAAVGDLQNTSPLSKVTAVLLILSASLRESVETWTVREMAHPASFGIFA